MADVTLVQGDTRPSLDGALKKTRNGVALDLSTASAVRFQMRKDDDRNYTVDAPAVIVSALAGTVRYDWADGDLNSPGDYLCQWEIEWADGTFQTTQPPNSLTVRRQ